MQIGSTLEQYNWNGSGATGKALSNAGRILAAAAESGAVAGIAGSELAPADIAVIAGAVILGGAVEVYHLIEENEANSTQMMAVPPKKEDNVVSTPIQEQNPDHNIVSTPIQTSQKGDNIVSGTPPDQNGNSDIGKDQGFTPNQQNPNDNVVTSDHPAWLNPDGTLIGSLEQGR